MSLDSLFAVRDFIWLFVRVVFCCREVFLKDLSSLVDSFDDAFRYLSAREERRQVFLNPVPEILMDDGVDSNVADDGEHLGFEGNIYEHSGALTGVEHTYGVEDEYGSGHRVTLLAFPFYMNTDFPGSIFLGFLDRRYDLPFLALLYQPVMEEHGYRN